MEKLLHKLVFIPYIIIVAAMVQTVVWMADREPPFEVLTGSVVPPVYVGMPMKIEGKVKRDTTRGCDLVVHHWIEDTNGFRHFFPDVSLSAESIKRLEEKYPGFTKYVVVLPEGVATGKAIYHAESVYICNPVHAVFWPITTVFRGEFLVEKRDGG